MLAVHEVRVELLPPYSPDLNPIEESFAELKQWIKKNKILAEGCDTFKDNFLELAVSHMQNKANNHFRSVHIAFND
jgi:transposase